MDPTPLEAQAFGFFRKYKTEDWRAGQCSQQRTALLWRKYELGSDQQS